MPPCLRLCVSVLARRRQKNEGALEFEQQIVGEFWVVVVVVVGVELLSEQQIQEGL